MNLAVFLYFYYENRAVRNQVTIFLLPMCSLLMTNSAHTSERVKQAGHITPSRLHAGSPLLIRGTVYACVQLSSGSPPSLHANRVSDLQFYQKTSKQSGIET